VKRLKKLNHFDAAESKKFVLGDKKVKNKFEDEMKLE
jgi:hypothetical protein